MVSTLQNSLKPVWKCEDNQGQAMMLSFDAYKFIDIT